MKDEILEEVWRNREALLAEHDGDLNRYVAHLKKLEKSSGRKVVSFEGKKAKPGYWGAHLAAPSQSSLGQKLNANFSDTNAKHA